MNKLLIVLLAVCLVSVHAFVKRETESTPDYLKNIQQQLEEYTKNFNTQVQNAFDSDKIKSEVNNFIESLGKILNTEKKEAPK